MDEAVLVLTSIPKKQWVNFLQLANVELEEGIELVRYAEQSSNSDLTFALVKVSSFYFAKKSPSYYNDLVSAIKALKENHLFHEEFLRKAVILNPSQVNELVKVGLRLQEQGLLTDERLCSVFIEHPDQILKLAPILVKLSSHQLLNEEDILKSILENLQGASSISEAIIKWKVAEMAKDDPIRELILFNHNLAQDNFRVIESLHENNLFDLWREKYIYEAVHSHPEEAKNLALLCIKYKNSKHLDCLPILLNGTNIAQRIKIGLMLLNYNLLNKLDEVDRYGLLEPDNAERLINALSFIKIKGTAYEFAYQYEKVNLDQLIDVFARQSRPH